MSSPTMPASPAMMKAMSHPLRWRIIAIINGLGHARATDISAELGEPVNSVSFHLRSLADVGILVEAPEFARDARERVWKMALPALNADPVLLEDDAAYRTAMGASIGLIYAEMHRAIVGEFGQPPDQRRPTHSEATSLRLTRHQVHALGTRIHELLMEFENDAEAAAAGVETDQNPDDRTTTVYSALFGLAPVGLETQPTDVADQS